MHLTNIANMQTTNIAVITPKYAKGSLYPVPIAGLGLCGGAMYGSFFPLS